MQEYEFHPFANAFPMMSDQEHAELVADIKANGQHEAIVLYHGKILDGRNRDRACHELGIEPRYVQLDLLLVLRRKAVLEQDWATGDAAAQAFVISKNLVRRHLTTSQRAMIAADLVTLGHGQRKSDTSIDVSQADAAKMTKTSLPTVQRASKVKQRGTPELVAAVKAGEVTLSAAVAQVDAVRQGEDEPDHGHDLETPPTPEVAEYAAWLNEADEPLDDLTEEEKEDARRDKIKRWQEWQASAAKTTDACDEMPDIKTPPGTTDAEYGVKPSKIVLRFCEQPLEFVQDYMFRLNTWISENPLNQRDKDQILSSVQACADGMQQLAQTLR
jgi:ParB-like chromosome segregation protein Spo0J